MGTSSFLHSARSRQSHFPLFFAATHARRRFESHEISGILGIVYCRGQMKGAFYAVSPFLNGRALEIKNLLTRRYPGDSLMRNRQWAFIKRRFNPQYGCFTSASTGSAGTRPIHRRERRLKLENWNSVATFLCNWKTFNCFSSTAA